MNKIRLDNKTFYYQVFYKNIKNMYLRVKANDMLQITCHKLTSETTIVSFIRQHETKILKHAETFEQKIPLYEENNLQLWGLKMQILYQTNCKRNGFQIEEDTIEIDFKNDYFDTKYVETIYAKLLLQKTLLMLDEIKPMLAPHLSIDDVTYKTQLMKSRFGSCIPKKRIIKLNTILARFPEVYLKTILIHELIHLKVANHQKDFYQYMNQFVPNYKQRRKELSKLMRKYVI